MAGRIYVTGDCHGDFRKFNTENFPQQRKLDKEDYVIICGDFGGIWNADGEDRHERHWLKWLEAKTYTTLFIDGNHENFDRLGTYPKKVWNGGQVHVIRPSVLHLMRGQVFRLGDKRIFTFGGASSHDISGGILDIEDPYFAKKKKRLDREYAPYRIRNLSWWEEELASDQEMEEGKRNLRKNDYHVDYIITHCCSTRTQELMGCQGLYDTDRQTEYLELIKNYTDYEKWYFGHYHMDKNVTSKEVLLYHRIVELGAGVDA